ncbi:MAG: hypothetical protein Tsb009_16150 [Planctomycetaceae bacterium]
MTDNHETQHDLLDEATLQLRDVSVPDGPPPNLIASTVEAIRRSTQTSERPSVEIIRQERKARMLRIARYSSVTTAAAVLVTFLAWLTFQEHQPNVAFGDVVQKVKEAKSVQVILRYKIHGPNQFSNEKIEIKNIWKIQGHHFRMEIPGQNLTVVDLKKKKLLTLHIPMKLAFISPAPRKGLGTENVVTQFQNLPADQAKRLKDEKVDGKKAYVYLFEDLDKVNLIGLGGEGYLKVWVDPKTKLPVKIVARSLGNPLLTFEKFEWNKKFDPKIFSTEVPPGYKLKKLLQGKDPYHKERSRN